MNHIVICNTAFYDKDYYNKYTKSVLMIYVEIKMNGNAQTCIKQYVVVMNFSTFSEN